MLQGGCHCGAVRYQCTAEPMMTGHCQCRCCQQLSGAGHASHMAFPKAAVSLTGEVKTYQWIADSGNTVTNAFCPKCGSPVYGTSTGFPYMVTIRAASLDDPSVFKPQMVVFARSAQPWDQIEGLPTFETCRPWLLAEAHATGGVERSWT
jgi:hypothetical protein